MLLRFSALLSALLIFSGCGDFSEIFGLDDVPRITVETEIPVTVRLPPTDLPPLPESVSQSLEIALPVDVVAHLKATGRDDDAELLEKNQSKIESVRLRSVSYEVRAPNATPADVDPVDLYFGPPEMGQMSEGLRLGQTVAIPAETAIALRELAYDPGALDAAAPQLSTLAFAVGVQTALTLEPMVPVAADALAIRLVLKVEVTVNILK